MHWVSFGKNFRRKEMFIVTQDTLEILTGNLRSGSQNGWDISDQTISNRFSMPQKMIMISANMGTCDYNDLAAMMLQHFGILSTFLQR